MPIILLEDVLGGVISMKIYDQSHLKLAKIYQQKAQERHNPQKTMHEEADRVEISQAAKELLGLTKK